MAEQPDGVDGVLVAVAGGKLENGKIHVIYDLRFTIYASNGSGPIVNRIRTCRGSFNFQFVIFDDGVAQKLVSRVVKRALRGSLVRAGREVNFDVFADVDAGDAVVAHMFERVLDGFALRINHGLFWCDDDFCFHARATEFCGKILRRASNF